MNILKILVIIMLFLYFNVTKEKLTFFAAYPLTTVRGRPTTYQPTEEAIVFLPFL